MRPEIQAAITELEQLASNNRIKELDQESVKYIGDLERYKKKEDAVRSKIYALQKKLDKDQQSNLSDFLKIIDSNRRLITKEKSRRDESKLKTLWKGFSEKFSRNYNSIPFFQGMYYAFKSAWKKPNASKPFYILATIIAFVGAGLSKIDSFLFDENNRINVTSDYGGSWRKHTFGMQWTRRLFNWSTSESKNFLTSGLKKLIAWPLLPATSLFEFTQIPKLVVRIGTSIIKFAGTIVGVLNDYTVKALANYVRNESSHDSTSAELASEIQSIRRHSQRSSSLSSNSEIELAEISGKKNAPDAKKTEQREPLIDKSQKKVGKILLLGGAVAACALTGGLGTAAVLAKVAITLKTKAVCDTVVGLGAGVISSKVAFFNKNKSAKCDDARVELHKISDDEMDRSPSHSL